MLTIRSFSKLVTVVVLIVLVQLLQLVTPGTEGLGPQGGPGDTVAVLGFLLLVAFLTGKGPSDCCRGAVLARPTTPRDVSGPGGGTFTAVGRGVPRSMSVR